MFNDSSNSLNNLYHHSLIKTEGAVPKLYLNVEIQFISEVQ